MSILHKRSYQEVTNRDIEAIHVKKCLLELTYLHIMPHHRNMYVLYPFCKDVHPDN